MYLHINVCVCVCVYMNESGRMVAHMKSNPSIWVGWGRQDNHEFEANLSYTGNSRSVSAT